jgi:3-deoxy-D-manno-octulosonic acid (KDO) 8-phosphate synthase
MEKFLKDLFAQQQYDEKNFFLIAGPCVVESEALLMEVAEKVSGICKNLGIPYIFKSSYRKANRTSASSFTGIGDEAALALVKKTGETFGLPTTQTFMHTTKLRSLPNTWIYCKYRPFSAAKPTCWWLLQKPGKLST